LPTQCHEHISHALKVNLQVYTAIESIHAGTFTLQSQEGEGKYSDVVLLAFIKYGLRVEKTGKRGFVQWKGDHKDVFTNHYDVLLLENLEDTVFQVNSARGTNQGSGSYIGSKFTISGFTEMKNSPQDVYNFKVYIQTLCVCVCVCLCLSVCLSVW